MFYFNSLTFIPLGFLFTAAVAGFWEESECGGVPQAVCWWSRCEDHRRNAQGLLFQLWKHRELRDHEGEEPDRQVSPENRRIWLSLFLLLIIIVNWSYDWRWINIIFTVFMLYFKLIRYWHQQLCHMFVVILDLFINIHVSVKFKNIVKQN